MRAPSLVFLTVAAFFVSGTTAAGDMSEPSGFALEGLFASMDVNKNGKVTRTELAQHTIIRFQSMDSDTDGGLDSEEFIAALLGPFRKSIKNRFAMLDADNSGVITEDELSRVMVRQFARFDGDWDGAVTLEELKAVTASKKAGN